VNTHGDGEIDAWLVLTDFQINKTSGFSQDFLSTLISPLFFYFDIGNIEFRKNLTYVDEKIKKLSE
jgi:hypothetical protein